ncbi:protein DEEPER ROOTING 1 [Cicer arietinum]
MQNRLNVSNEKKKPSSVSATHYMVNDTNKQEFNDLPQALVLAIGTFGNYNLKEDSNKSIAEEESPSFHDCSFEEVGNFHNELNIILEENNFNLSNNLIYNKGKECLDKSKNGVSKKALTFFLKMFVCGGGLPPTPLFKDPLSIESRMEKIMRAVLHKKIHPHGSCSTTFVKKYLENDPMPQYEDIDDEEEELTTSAIDKGCKWVKTDSECMF